MRPVTTELPADVSSPGAEAGAPASPARPLGSAAGVLLLLPALGWAGFCQLFSSLARYDDEGYVLLSLRTYLAGHPLYDQTYSQYGPAYFALEGAWHRLLRMPVTHDVARWKTLAAWLLSALLAGGIVQRLTGRRWLALATIAAAWLHLDRLGLEPAHPQELALPLLLGALWIATAPSRGKRWKAQSTTVLLGACAGALGLIKPNLGLLTGLALAIALLLSLPRSRGGALGVGAGIIAAASLPFALAGRHVASWEGAALPAAVLCGCLGLAIHSGGNPRVRSDSTRAAERMDWCWRDLLWCGLAAAGTGAVFAAVPLAGGTSFSGLWYGLVEQHQRFLDLFYHHPPLPAWSIGWSTAMFALAVLSRRSEQARLTALWICPIMLFLTALQTLTESWIPIDHGLTDRAGAGLLAACVTPLAWLVLLPPPSGIVGGGPAFARRLLCASALVQPLGMYPTPGTQAAIGTLPALLVLVVGVSDLHGSWRAHQRGALSILRPLVLGWGAVVLLTAVCRDVQQTCAWKACQPLGLPGAEWLRLPPEEVVARREVVDILRRQADTFIASPSGCCSLYLWSGLEPPTPFNATFWEVLLNPRQQQAVIEALEQSRRPLLVVDRGQSPVRHRDSPLHLYLERSYAPWARRGRYEIRRRVEGGPHNRETVGFRSVGEAGYDGGVVGRRPTSGDL